MNGTSTFLQACENLCGGLFFYVEGDDEYENVAGFCYKAQFEDIEKNGFVLIPGRYVGAPEEEDDGEPFVEKMRRLTSLLMNQQEEGSKLDQQIAENLKRIGYGN